MDDPLDMTIAQPDEIDDIAMLHDMIERRGARWLAGVVQSMALANVDHARERGDHARRQVQERIERAFAEAHAKLQQGDGVFVSGRWSERRGR